MDENEEMYLEDAMDDVMSEALDHAKTLEPGSPEHIAVVSEINTLYNTRAKAAEIDMKYKSEEAQRAQERELKLYEYQLRKKEMDIKERELNIRCDELATQKKANKVDAIYKGVETAGKIGTAAGVGILMARCIQAEYGDMRFMNSGPWRFLTGIAGRSINLPGIR